MFLKVVVFDIKNESCSLNFILFLGFFLVFFLIGKMKGLAFVQDPDGYWIEILNPNHMVTLT